MNQILRKHEVLTTTEAARYLRLKKPQLEKLAELGQVQARKIHDEWRFLRSALEEWLRGNPDPNTAIFKQAGLFRDDPDLHGILADIYNARGRPECEAD